VGDAGTAEVPRAPQGEGLASGDPAAGGSGGPGDSDGAASPLSRAEEERVRELVAGMVRNRFDQASEGRLRRTLERLGIQLDEGQQKRLDEALTQHRERIRETVRQARDSETPREEVRALVGGQTQRLTESLAAFMHPADAERLTQALTQRPDGGQAGGPRERAGGGRGR
jgi:hypothetical protein